MSRLTIRPAAPDDAVALQRLAELDSARVPAGALLIAEMDGVLAAALSIQRGVAIADPFCPTAGVVELLALRGQQLRGEKSRSKRGHLRRWLRRNGSPRATLIRLPEGLTPETEA